MSKLTAALKEAAKAPFWLHEYIHWVTAQALGVPAEIVNERLVVCELQPQAPWKDVAIDLAPALFGLIMLLPWAVGWVLVPKLVPLWYAGAWFWVVWLLNCWRDVFRVLEYFYHGDWIHAEEIPDGQDLAGRPVGEH